jgi:hypothetical protein
VLALVKPSGLWISIIALVLFYINELRNRKNQKGKKNIISLFTPVASVLLAYFSWKVFVSLSYTDISSNSIVIKYQEIINLISGNYKPYQYDTFVAFAKFLTEHDFSFYSVRLFYTSYLIIMSLIGTFFTFSAEDEQEKKKRKVFSLSIVIGVLVYTISLLFLYLFSFTETEAVALAACQRYLSTYFFGGLSLLVFLILLNKKKCFSILIALSMLILVNYTPITQLTVLSRVKSAETEIAISQYDDIKDIRSKLDYTTDKVYFLDLNPSHGGYDYWASRYLFTPVKMNPEGTWRIGTKYSESDITTYITSSEEWAKLLVDGEYTHVYLLEATEKFKQNFGQLFENGADSIQEKTFYKIEEAENTVIIKKVN